jgi:antitoxin component YwqK of YwqJK toxin-antitoxin module
MKKIFLLIFFFILSVSFVFAETTVKRIAIAKSIKNKEPVGVSDTFYNPDKLYCFTEVKTNKYPTKIVHIWLYNDNIIAEVPLEVNSYNWRTFSSKTIYRNWKGDWKVEVYSEEGKLIDSISFKITDKPL